MKKITWWRDTFRSPLYMQYRVSKIINPEGASGSWRNVIGLLFLIAALALIVER